MTVNSHTSGFSNSIPGSWVRNEGASFEAGRSARHAPDLSTFVDSTGLRHPGWESRAGFHVT
jgi:hypothetical protein